MATQPVPAQTMTRRWVFAAVAGGRIQNELCVHYDCSWAMISSTSFTPLSGVICAMHLVVHHHDRRQAAGAEARDRFDGEQHVVGGAFFAFELEPLADGVEDRDGILHVARRAVAQADEVFALRLEWRSASRRWRRR